MVDEHEGPVAAELGKILNEFQGQQGPTEKDKGEGKKGDKDVTEEQGETTQMATGKGKTRKKKPVLPEGEAYVPWDWESMVLPVSYFRDEVKLPSSGLQVLAISSSKVSDDMLKATFGPRNPSNGYTISKGKGFSIAALKELTCLLDGKPNPLNLCLTKHLAKGIYADFILKEPVDWASYAHDKHMVQMKSHFDKGGNKPTGPPLVRELRVYQRFLQPKIEGHEDISKVRVPQVNTSTPLVESIIAATDYLVPNVPDASVVLHTNKVDCETPSNMTHVSDSVAQSPSFPFFGQPLDVWQINTLKAAINEHKEKSEKFLKEQHDTNSSIGTLRHSEDSAQRRVDEFEIHCQHEYGESQRIKQEILQHQAHKRTVMMEVDEAQEDMSDTDEDDMEKMKLLEEIIRDVDSKIAQLEMHLIFVEESGSEWKTKKTAASIEVVEIQKQITALSSELSAHDAANEVHESALASLKEELRILTRHFEKTRIVLLPRSIPTSVELRSRNFWITVCPICNLGFHCQNFMPTSCGHSYHPSCILPLLASAVETPTCFACDQPFHPDWLKTWGVPCQHPTISALSDDLGLDAQRAAHDNALTQLYSKQAAMLKERRQLEVSSHKRVSFKWNKEEVAKNTRQCIASMVARNVGKQVVTQKSNGTDFSGLSGAEASKVDADLCGSEDDAEMLEVKIEGSKAGRKRKSSTGEVAPRKLATRSMTEAVLATTDFSPSEPVVVKQKKLESVKSPSKGSNPKSPSKAAKSPKETKSSGHGKSPRSKLDGGSAKSTTKSTQNKASRRKLNIG